MRPSLAVVLFLMTDSVGAVTGYKGGAVIIRCKYSEDKLSKEKYLCISTSQRSCSKAISTTKPNIWQKRGRYSLYDDRSRHTFSVIIRELQDGDMKLSYWCTVKTFLSYWDYKVPVGLRVLADDCCGSPARVEAYIGGSVTINCKYPENEENNIRSFCKQDVDFDCKPLISAHGAKDTRKGKFSLRDPRQTGAGNYSVTISNLQAEDQGVYWCAMMEAGFISQLTEVTLHILMEKPTEIMTSTTSASPRRASAVTSDPPASSVAPPPSGPEGSAFPGYSLSPVTTPESKQSGILLKISLSVSLGLLALAFIPLLLIYRRKIKKEQGVHTAVVSYSGSKEGRDGECNYEVIRGRPTLSDSGSAFPSINVSPSDSLHYAVVTFHKWPGCVNDAPVSEENPFAVYSTVKKAPTAVGQPLIYEEMQ